ncbi:MAG: hypothetical protein QXT19_02960 [Candidatus Woesearchaeota archaeon]
MKMAKIPAWVWLATGVAVALAAWYANLTLFFWVGWVFVVFGIAKLIGGYVLRGKETQREKELIHEMAPHRMTYAYFRCSCGNPVRTTDIFCNSCGRRLR